MKQYDWLQNGVFFLPAKVYTTTKTLMVENFKHGCQHNNIFFATMGALQRSSFGGNLKPSDKKLDLQKTWNSRHSKKIKNYCLSILSVTPTVASNNLVLGWNSWPTGILLHCSWNRRLVLNKTNRVGATKYNIITLDIAFRFTNLIVDPGVVTPTLNVNLTLFVIPCRAFGGIIDLQYCSYCHLLSDFSSGKFQSSMTKFHHNIFVRMQNIPNFVPIARIWMKVEMTVEF